MENFAVIILDPDGNVSGWSAGAEAATGHTSATALDRNYSLFFPSEAIAEGRPGRILRSAQAEGFCAADGVFLDADGSHYRTEARVTAQFDDSGSLRGFAVLMRDPGAPQAVVDADSDAGKHKRFGDIMMESMRGVLYLYDQQGRFLRWNRTLETASGYSAEEIERMHPLDFFPERERAAVQARIDEVFGSGESYVEATLLSKDGSKVPYCFSGRRVDFEGKDCLVGVGIDITILIAARQGLADSERRYRKLFEYAPDGILIADAQSRYLDANPAICRMLGYSREELVTMGAEDIVDPDEIDQVGAALTSIKGIGGYHREWRFRRKDGVLLEAEVMATLMPDGTLMGMVRDISERKQAQMLGRALLESELRFRELAETVQEVFWMTDPGKTRMLYVSPAYEKVWGRTCASLYQAPESWVEAILPEDRERIRSAARRRQESGEYDESFRIRRADGTVRWIRDRAYPVRDAEGKVVRLVGTAEDITERRQLEEQFRLSQKMEAIGQLAAGVAHDFNNIIAVILGFSELAQAQSAKGRAATESLEEIIKASVRAKDLVQQILTFSRQQPQERKVMPIGPTVRETVGFLRAVISKDIEFAVEIDTDVPDVLADPTQLHQVIANLCTNAWHAMEGKAGRIEVKLKSVVLNSADAGRLAGMRSGRVARLTVSDTGKGIDAAVLDRIFDPFFTTKEPGKGTGLGLSVVQGIVQNHDGAITVSSQTGQGSVFQVYLPAALAAEAAPVPEKGPGAGQHILYLDDEKAIVEMASYCLKGQGFSVSGFTLAADALRAFHENPDRFDLIISDMNMPGQSGLQFATELLKLRPGLPIVICSGHVTDDLRSRARNAGIRDVLFKPGTMEEFGETILDLIAKTLSA